MTPSEDGTTRRSPGVPLDARHSPIDSQLSAPPPIVEAALVQDVSSDPSSSEPSELLQNRGIVLAMLFLVTGFLGIPLLWVNQKFSNTERIIWSIIVTIYTSALIWLVYLIVMWSYRRIFP